ncbi:MAG: hypothetical protein AAFU54_09920 [Chloroflexota bacterium]
MNDRLRQITVVVLSIAQLAANALNGAGLLFSNGVTVGEISDSFRTFFTPAGYTFAVWGPIYLGLTAYAIYQALPSQTERTIHRRVGWLAASAALSNTIWTPLFTSAGVFGTESFSPVLVVLSFIVIVWMLASLAAIFVIIRNMGDALTAWDRALVEVPFYGYFAWVNVATVASGTTTLIALGWEGAQVGAIASSVMIGAATLIVASLLLYSNGTPGTVVILAVLLWALIGVYAGNNPQSELVGTSAVMACGVLTGVGLYRMSNRLETTGMRTPATA